MSQTLWEDDSIQFARLLAEIGYIGMSDGDVQAICESMDISEDEFNQLLIRADIAWEKAKLKRLEQNGKESS